MNSGELTPGTLVIASGVLGEIARFRRLYGRSDGYDVMLSEYPDPQAGGCGATVLWHEKWCVKPAVLDVTVCRTPRLRCICACTCGLAHIRHPEWLASVAQQGEAGSLKESDVSVRIRPEAP